MLPVEQQRIIQAVVMIDCLSLYEGELTDKIAESVDGALKALLEFAVISDRIEWLVSELRETFGSNPELFLKVIEDGLEQYKHLRGTKAEPEDPSPERPSPGILG